MVRSLVREALGSDARPPRRAAPDVIPADLTAPDARAAAHVAAARTALHAGDPEACAQAAEDALAIEDDNLFAAFYLGQARLRQGRLAEARLAFETVRDGGDPFGLAAGWLARVDELVASGAPRLAPSVAAGIEMERAARAALRAGDAERARQLAAEAVAADAENLLAHHLLGRALQALGRREEALAAFDAARAHEAGLGLVDDWIEHVDEEGDWASGAGRGGG